MRTDSHRAVEVVFRAVCKGWGHRPPSARKPQPGGIPEFLDVPRLRSRNATANGRLPLLVTPPCAAQLPSGPCLSAFSLINLKLQRILSRNLDSAPRPSAPTRMKPARFAHALKKKRVFPCIFAVSPLRSFSAFAIVPNGPSLRRKTRGSFARR